MIEQFIPTTEQVREAFREACLTEDDLDFDDAPGRAFDAWIAARDAEVREQIAQEIEAAAFRYAGDFERGLNRAAEYVRGA